MSVRNPSDKNLELLRLLTNSVRVMTVSQAAFALREPELERMKSRLRRLKSQGMVDLSTAWFQQPQLGELPLFSWQGEGRDPDCGQLARMTQGRWASESRSETVAVATPKTRNLYGAVPVRAPRESEIAHDLWVSELFLHRYANHRVYSWLHEDGFGDLFPEGSKPDAALIQKETDSAPLAVELLGNYRREKIEQFHTYCLEHGIRYEFW